MMVDIVVRSKNGQGLLDSCLSSIRENTTAGTYRLIVVDDGSDPPLKFDADVSIRNYTAKGAVSATNLGLSAALMGSAPYVLVLDNDTEIPSGDNRWLDRFVSELEVDEQTAAVGATSSFVKGRQFCLAAPTTYTGDWSGEKGSGTKVNPPVSDLVSFCILLRKSAVKRVGLWDTRYDPGNWEDTDYSVQLRLAGYHLRVARSVYVHHVGHQTFGDGLSFLLKSNQAKFIEKWGLGRLCDLGIIPWESVKRSVA